MYVFFKELLIFLRVRRKLWLTPLIVFMVIIAALLVLTQSSVLAPLIYALF